MEPAIPALHHDTILDSINEGVFTVDLDWRIKSFNAAAERITRISRGDAASRKCHDVLRSSLCQQHCAMLQTLTTGRSVVNATAVIRNALGQHVPVRISTALLKDQKGAMIGGVETFQDLSEVEQLRKELSSTWSLHDIIGRSPAMRRIFQALPQIADSGSSVLIEGASGTGKELFAKTIHALSPRSNGPFVAVNCGALPDTLLESELFGYKAGAFTDAKRDKPGRIGMAHGGALFLDELGDISPALQVKLLRVLQERCIEPLGGVRPQKVDVRILAASNQDLKELVRTGAFREDLYYRIRVVRVQIPPLTERTEDIPLLAEHCISKFNRLQGKDIAGISDQAMARLLTYSFPGNVRELENIIEHAFVFCKSGLIRTRHLTAELREGPPPAPANQRAQLSLKSMERACIIEALQRFAGNRAKTAACLGIDPSTLYRKMYTLRIPLPEKDGRSRNS